MLELSPDWRVLAFALGLAALTGLAFGIGPAWRAADVDSTTRLRGESAAAESPHPLRQRADRGQLALSLVLLVGAGLFMRALGFGARVEPGFRIDGVSVGSSTNTEAWGYDEPQGRAFYGRLRDRLAAVPGVAAVSYAGRVP